MKTEAGECKRRKHDKCLCGVFLFALKMIGCSKERKERRGKRRENSKCAGNIKDDVLAHDEKKRHRGINGIRPFPIDRAENTRGACADDRRRKKRGQDNAFHLRACLHQDRYGENDIHGCVHDAPADPPEWTGCERICKVDVPRRKGEYNHEKHGHEHGIEHGNARNPPP